MEVTNFYNYGTMNQVEAGATQINYNNYGSKVAEQSEAVGLPRLLECVGSVRSYFWGDSSMAVIFCVCRDCFGYPDNMSQFEREFNCSEGLLSNTFRNNPYMRMPVDKWRENGAKERVLRLVDAFKNAVNGNTAQ
ncbi:MAG: hypothetical protein K5899_02450 [Bacteroidaceae bacterium]|nr:hypothetical protein [Bacteroidaceae bacterium]